MHISLLIVGPKLIFDTFFNVHPAPSPCTSGSANSTYDNAQYTSHLTGPMGASGLAGGAGQGRDTPTSTMLDTVRHAINSQPFGHVVVGGTRAGLGAGLNKPIVVEVRVLSLNSRFRIKLVAFT